MKKRGRKNAAVGRQPIKRMQKNKNRTIDSDINDDDDPLFLSTKRKNLCEEPENQFQEIKIVNAEEYFSNFFEIISKYYHWILKSYLIFLSDHLKCNQSVKTSEKIFEEVQAI